MNLLLDVLQALGLGLAAGLAPFLAALVAGAFGQADTAVDFEGTSFAFLEAPWWLVVMAVALVAAFFVRARAEQALQGTGIGLGGLLGAGTVADRSDLWPIGLVAGVLGGLLAVVVVGGLLRRVRARLDAGAAGALPLYAYAAGALAAVLCLVLPPVAVLLAAALLVLLVRGRRREGEKYAGLRVLR